MMFKGFKKLIIIIMGGISLMMILTACGLVKKDHQWVQEH
ncbi:Lipoprotein, putative [Streptococcus agalactiae]|nr:Lipoprotein, putative [Streptococcus agalactiae]